jgi:hypothetical protein
MPATSVLRALAGTLSALLLGGCSLLGDVRRNGPTRTPAFSAPPSTAASGPVTFEIRAAPVPAPADYQQQTVDFWNADQGAALFTRCAVPEQQVGNHNGCTAILLVTDDGGANWQQLEHPEPVADSQQLYLGHGKVLLLLAEPHAWYVSQDLGSTFKRFAYADGKLPPAYHTLDGPYEVCCDGEADPAVRHWVDDKPQRLAEPPLPGQLMSVHWRPGRDLWVSSVADGTVYTGFSVDDGRTWTAVAVPGQVGGIGYARLVGSLDGADVWLVADRDRRDFPSIWRLGDGAWSLPIPADGHPDTYLAVAALGVGLLAFGSRDTAGLVTLGGRYLPTDWPRGWLRTLDDGTLFATDDRTGTLWLGSGAAGQRRWIRIELQPVQPSSSG